MISAIFFQVAARPEATLQLLPARLHLKPRQILFHLEWSGMATLKPVRACRVFTTIL